MSSIEDGESSWVLLLVRCRMFIESRYRLNESTLESRTPRKGLGRKNIIPNIALKINSFLSLRVGTRFSGNWDKNRGENRVPPKRFCP